MHEAQYSFRIMDLIIHDKLVVESLDLKLLVVSLICPVWERYILFSALCSMERTIG